MILSRRLVLGSIDLAVPPKCAGNLRLQEMMSVMVSERGGMLYATDDRCDRLKKSDMLYVMCISKGAHRFLGTSYVNILGVQNESCKHLLARMFPGETASSLKYLLIAGQVLH
jgi:hypothetical protein